MLEDERNSDASTTNTTAVHYYSWLLIPRVKNMRLFKDLPACCSIVLKSSVQDEIKKKQYMLGIVMTECIKLEM